MGETEKTAWLREQARKLRREENLTYQEIANEMGVSKQYIAQIMREDVKTKHFHVWKCSRLPYPALVDWLNEHQMTPFQLAREMGYVVGAANNTARIISDIKEGKIKKARIDRLISLTGLSYEVLFEEAV